MPKGPKGEKRPADAIGLAVLVGKIATGEVEDKPQDDGKDKAAQEMGRKGGKRISPHLPPEKS
ncbi:histone H1 [Pararhodobacter sp. SW119]|uniref:histone H1 n=1 Tax=Pararhodobacter sp. SW119 TaxID=2780075 RepID=UPI001ADFA0D8|nr:histone H1 [Pararhodobacter sp. SW119]